MSEWTREMQQRAEELCNLPSGRTWYWQEALSEEESSTPGGVPDKVIIDGYAGCHDLFEDGFLSPGDAQFIAGARQVLPTALARIRELEAALEKSVCGDCKGRGVFGDTSRGHGIGGQQMMGCPTCEGEGRVTP